MKIDNNYKLRDIAGECIVVNQGTEQVSMTRIISLNESARTLYEALQGKDFETEDVAKVLIDTYQISQEQAMTDAAKWISGLQKCGIIE